MNLMGPRRKVIEGYIKLQRENYVHLIESEISKDEIFVLNTRKCKDKKSEERAFPPSKC